MAHYNTETDKIKGCKKYSKLWWHEKGHQKLNNSEFGSELTSIQHYSFFILLLSIVLNNPLLIKITLFTIFIIPELAHEIFAWIYCYKNKNKWKKRENEKT